MDCTDFKTRHGSRNLLDGVSHLSDCDKGSGKSQEALILRGQAKKIAKSGKICLP